MEVGTRPRNAPCPCGSGLRFKHCHGLPVASIKVGTPPTLDFVVAGGQRCGTSSVDLYLREHPGVSMPTTTKELHFFDDEANFRSASVDYAAYHANFGDRKPAQLRGEVTPSYIYWTPAAGRLARYNPALKVIVLLRNPITRAHSHWNKERQQGHEPLSFLEALRAEPARARAAQPLQDRRASYVDRGFYVGQLQRLWHHFPARQTLILRSEALNAQPGETLKRIAGFLGLARFPPVVPVVANGWEYAQPIGSVEWELLADTFAGDIRELEHLLGWNCASWLRRPEVNAQAT